MIWQRAVQLLRAARPYQWLSNVVILAPLVFSYNLFDPALLARSIGGFVLLCCLSSAVFLVNDVVDRERDRSHPVRQHRPIAAGQLPPRQATAAAILLAVLPSIVALAWQPAFGLAAAGYLLLGVGYSLGLRRLPVLDVMSIAAGLVLRAVSGALLIQVTISPWFYLSVGGLGLILALGRVQHEMGLAQSAGTLELSKYTPQAVIRMNAMALAFTLIVYCLYTFLATGLPANYTMVLTIPFALYAIFRYRYLGHQEAGEKSSEQFILSDPPFLVAACLWALSSAGVLYLFGG